MNLDSKSDAALQSYHPVTVLSLELLICIVI